jgi:SAM-dependent methyltransferase
LESAEHFDNPTGELIFGQLVPPANYRAVLDFGCGCGRLARQMLQQRTVPERFVGLDLHAPSIEWCQSNLTQPGFQFRHLNAYNVALNPSGERQVGFGVEGHFTLINAHSVFTHILEPDLEFYFEQCARRLSPLGVFRSTWFLFDKAAFPMMASFQNCLYINAEDPTNAAIYDLNFVRRLFSSFGLRIAHATPPAVRGHQWMLLAERGTGAHAPITTD